MAVIFSVIVRCTGSAYRLNALLTEKVQREFMYRTKCHSVAISVSNEIHQLHDPMVSGKLLYIVLSGNEVGPAYRTTDVHSMSWCWHRQTPQRCRVRASLGFCQAEQLINARLAERMMASQHSGKRHVWKSDFADVASEKPIFESVFIQDHAAFVERKCWSSGIFIQ